MQSLCPLRLTVTPFSILCSKKIDRSPNVLPEIPLDFQKRTDLVFREVELEHEKRVSQLGGISSDVGLAEELVETVFEVDVVVVREHRAYHRLAEPLRAQKHRGRHFLQFADIRGIVHYYTTNPNSDVGLFDDEQEPVQGV